MAAHSGLPTTRVSPGQEEAGIGALGEGRRLIVRSKHQHCDILSLLQRPAFPRGLGVKMPSSPQLPERQARRRWAGPQGREAARTSGGPLSGVTLNPGLTTDHTSGFRSGPYHYHVRRTSTGSPVVSACVAPSLLLPLHCFGCVLPSHCSPGCSGNRQPCGHHFLPPAEMDSVPG